MTPQEILDNLPSVADLGRKGQYTWKGYKLHVDCGDGGIPISAIVTSASLHDSQAAIPLEEMTSRKVIRTCLKNVSDPPTFRFSVDKLALSPENEPSFRPRRKGATEQGSIFETGSSLYTLMDKAYDAKEIRTHATGKSKVALISPQKRQGDAVLLDPAQHIRMRERTTIERVFSRLKDHFGASQVRVRGHTKVSAHLMFGILALTVEQIVRTLH